MRKLSESTKKSVAFSQEWKCGNCKQLLPASYQVDHIIPFSISKDDNTENLMALCPNCHGNKSQIEYNRIIQYKKFKAENNLSYLCWFCLNIDSIEHHCDKKFKKIYNNNNINNPIDVIDKYNYTNEKINVLTIELNYRSVMINNLAFNIDENNYTLKEISRIIHLVTRTKKAIKKYDTIDIIVNDKINDEDGIIDYISDNYEDLLPNRILKNEIFFNFIFNNKC